MKHPDTANRLRTALTDIDMTARELSNRSGVSEQSISQYTNGKNKPSNESSALMAKVLGVNPLWLMGFDVPKHDTLALIDIPQEEKKLLRAFRKLDDGQKDMIFRMLNIERE